MRVTSWTSTPARTLNGIPLNSSVPHALHEVTGVAAILTILTNR
jgi:hypothetical protein